MSGHRSRASPPQVFKDRFRGKLVTQMEYEGEIREKQEDFMCLSLQVRHLASLEEAMTKLIERSTVEDFAWDEEPSPRVDIQRRSVLGELPQTIIVHLERFTMNLNTYQTEKLNSKFEARTPPWFGRRCRWMYSPPAVVSITNYECSISLQSTIPTLPPPQCCRSRSHAAYQPLSPNPSYLPATVSRDHGFRTLHPRRPGMAAEWL